MKKIIALILSIVMICCCAVTAFAAESPVADGKVTLEVKKAEGKEITVDTKYTVSVGDVISLSSNSKYGTFNSWSVYKTVESKTVEAVEGVDYEIVKGSTTTGEISIKLLSTSVVVCANYDNVKTNPEAPSKADGSASSPTTGDMTAVYAVVAMLGVAAFAFGAKKVYSK